MNFKLFSVDSYFDPMDQEVGLARFLNADKQLVLAKNIFKYDAKFILDQTLSIPNDTRFILMAIYSKYEF